MRRFFHRHSRQEPRADAEGAGQRAVVDRQEGESDRMHAVVTPQYQTQAQTQMAFHAPYHSPPPPPSASLPLSSPPPPPPPLPITTNTVAPHPDPTHFQPPQPPQPPQLPQSPRSPPRPPPPPLHPHPQSQPPAAAPPPPLTRQATNPHIAPAQDIVSKIGFLCAHPQATFDLYLDLCDRIVRPSPTSNNNHKSPPPLSPPSIPPRPFSHPPPLPPYHPHPHPTHHQQHPQQQQQQQQGLIQAAKNIFSSHQRDREGAEGDWPRLKPAIKALRAELLRSSEPSGKLVAIRLWALLFTNHLPIVYQELSNRKWVDALDGLARQTVSDNPSQQLIKHQLILLWASQVHSAFHPGTLSPRSLPVQPYLKSTWQALFPDQPDGYPLPTEPDAVPILDPTLTILHAFPSISPPHTYTQSLPHPHAHPSLLSPPQNPPSHPRPEHMPAMPSQQAERDRLRSSSALTINKAQMLIDTLASLEPPSSIETNDLAREFYSDCLQQQEFIVSQLQWASAQAERSRAAIDAALAANLSATTTPKTAVSSTLSPTAPSPFLDGQTTGEEQVGEQGDGPVYETEEEALLSLLLKASSKAGDAIKMYDDLCMMAQEQEQLRQVQEHSLLDTRFDRTQTLSEGQTSHEFAHSAHTIAGDHIEADASSRQTESQAFSTLDNGPYEQDLDSPGPRSVIVDSDQDSLRPTAQTFVPEALSQARRRQEQGPQGTAHKAQSSKSSLATSEATTEQSAGRTSFDHASQMGGKRPAILRTITSETKKWVEMTNHKLADVTDSLTRQKLNPEESEKKGPSEKALGKRRAVPDSS